MTILVFSSGCASDVQTSVQSVPQAPARYASPEIQVVTTTSIVADWISNIGGDRVEVTSLGPRGKDPHSYVPTASDVAQIVDSDLILNIGLGFEGIWYEELIHNAVDDSSKVLTLGAVVRPLKFFDSQENHELGDSYVEGVRNNVSYDPHFWFDPLRVQIAVDFIAENLAALDSQGSDMYRANALAYNQQLDGLHQWTQDQVGGLATADRTLVTSHHNMQYFADLYGFKIVGSVIPSTGTEMDPSSEHLASLIEETKEHNVPVIFGELTFSEQIAITVARETDAQLVRLHSGSLGASDSDASTYIKMIKSNVKRIVDGLND